MDWTAGYTSDIEYLAGFYREQAPHYLNFACVLNGFEPVALGRAFTYFELGFGRGLTVSMLAAAYPQGQFYATDFNPAHVSGAQQIADEAGLSNLTLLEKSFSELAEGQESELPQFDFITLHGVYTWITEDNRQNIVRFISRYLKPGGVVYVSYNAMPGWSASLPLQRLLVEYAELYPNRSDFQVKNAAGFVDSLVNAEASFFMSNPGLKPRLDSLKNASPQYLVHEYMHKHWQPLYHADVVRSFHDAKLDYVGSADILHAMPGMFLPPDKLALINSVSDPLLRETVKDYLLNTSFRKDIFIRGARRLAPVKQQHLLSQFGLALTVPHSALSLSHKFSLVEINGKPDLYMPVVELLAEKPMTLSELAEQLGNRQEIINSLAQIAAFLVSSDQAGVYLANQSESHSIQKSTGRFNRVISSYTRYCDDYRALASPLTGGGINASYIARMFYFVYSQNDRADEDAMIRAIYNMLLQQQVKMVKDGKPMEWEAGGMAELRAQVNRLMRETLPVWHNLGVL